LIDSLTSGQTVTESFTLFATDGSLTSAQNFDINITGAIDPKRSSGSDSSGSSSDSSSGTSSDNSSGTSSDNSSDGSSTNDAYLDTLIGSLINEPTSSTNQFSNFLTSADSVLIASNDLSILKLQSPQTEMFDSEAGVGDTDGTQRMQWNQLSSFDLKNGVRIMLPNFLLADWKDNIPSERAGEIPMFISLLKKPDQIAKVNLQAEALPATLSKNILHFTPDNWDQTQIVWAKINDSGSERLFLL